MLINSHLGERATMTSKQENKGYGSRACIDIGPVASHTGEYHHYMAANENGQCLCASPSVTSNSTFSTASFPSNAHGTFNNHFHDNHILLNGNHSNDQSALTACECVIAGKSKSCEAVNSESVSCKSDVFGDTACCRSSKESRVQDTRRQLGAADFCSASPPSARQKALSNQECATLLTQNNSESLSTRTGFEETAINGLLDSDTSSNTVSQTEDDISYANGRYQDISKSLFEKTTSDNKLPAEPLNYNQELNLNGRLEHAETDDVIQNGDVYGTTYDLDITDTCTTAKPANERFAKPAEQVQGATLSSKQIPNGDIPNRVLQNGEEADVHFQNSDTTSLEAQENDRATEPNIDFSEYVEIESSPDSSDTELCDSSEPHYSDDDNTENDDDSAASPTILQSPRRFLSRTFRNFRKPEHKPPPASVFFPVSKSLDHISHELSSNKSFDGREDRNNNDKSKRDNGQSKSPEVHHQQNRLSRVAAFFGLSFDEQTHEQTGSHFDRLTELSDAQAWGTSFDGSSYRLRQPAKLYTSLDEDTFLHVKTWFQQYDTNPCSKTETFYLQEYRSEEPAQTNMDISTGHIVLAYMEDHLANKERLEEEWEGLQAYEAEPNATTVASEPANARKNRYADVLPYDHSRVVLNAETNVSGSDYINANSITDHDPRNPAYIATQGPLPHTVADFWQMVWEQGSVVIVNLTKLTENGNAMCHRYWPEEGSDLYHIYEVHLVSEHIWCDEYLVRSFYLKNLQTNETRTVTQFHFVAWPDLGIPASIKVLLDFRRKVNKSYRGRSCPIAVHCSDGMGRTGTYCLIDMVLNRMSKGAKEIDIAATLEHIRDQRMQMVKTKEQFELALATVAEEVNSILKALPSS